MPNPFTSLRIPLQKSSLCRFLVSTCEGPGLEAEGLDLFPTSSPPLLGCWRWAWVKSVWTLDEKIFTHWLRDAICVLVSTWTLGGKILSWKTRFQACTSNILRDTGLYHRNSKLIINVYLAPGQSWASGVNKSRTMHGCAPKPGSNMCVGGLSESELGWSTFTQSGRVSTSKKFMHWSNLDVNMKVLNE